MNRRDFLQFLAAVPLTGLVAREAQAQPAVWPVEPDTFGVKLVEDGDWKGMAELLWGNFQRYAASTPDQWDADELKLMEPICYRFCHALLNDEDRHVGWGSHSLAHSFYPDQPEDLIVKNVKFGVMEGPVAMFKGESKPAQARRLKIASFAQMKASMEDLRAFHGIDAEVEMVSCCGMEAALEALCEIRNDWKQGRETKLYAVYLPPFLTTVSPEMAKEFSVDRRWRTRYAKFV